MRFSAILATVFAASAWAAPALDERAHHGAIIARADNSTSNSTSSSPGGGFGGISEPTGMDELCDAKGVCTPDGGWAACDAKCKACEGPQGAFAWGTCCGLIEKYVLWTLSI